MVNGKDLIVSVFVSHVTINTTCTYWIESLLLGPVTATVSGRTTQYAGEQYTLTCVVSGGGNPATTYRWHRGGRLLSGKTSDTITFSLLRQTPPSSNGQFTCEATRSRRTVQSENFEIFVRSKELIEHVGY